MQLLKARINWQWWPPYKLQRQWSSANSRRMNLCRSHRNSRNEVNKKRIAFSVVPIQKEIFRSWNAKGNWRYRVGLSQYVSDIPKRKSFDNYIFTKKVKNVDQDVNVTQAPLIFLSAYPWRCMASRGDARCRYEPAPSQVALLNLK